MSKTVYLGSPLPLQRSSRGYFATTADALENEKSKFINLMLTMKGERVGNPGFGCDLPKLLFEQKTTEVQELAQQYVLNAVNQWMPYLRLRQVQILNEETFLNDNSILLYVQYGFVNNPLAVQSVQLRIGEVAQGSLISSGRLTTI
jgi:phage baseplate assembly protein W